MKVELINPFRDNTINVISTMSQTEVEAGDPKPKESNAMFGVVSGVMGLAGRIVKVAWWLALMNLPSWRSFRAC